jgi:hypothetical protein
LHVNDLGKFLELSDGFFFHKLIPRNRRGARLIHWRHLARRLAPPRFSLPLVPRGARTRGNGQELGEGFENAVELSVELS